MEENPNKAEFNRQPDGTFGPGNLANPKGRPVGKTLKEWLKDKLAIMTEEQREEFLKDIPREMQWRMAEGNPAQDVTSGGEKIQPLSNLSADTIKQAEELLKQKKTDG